MCKGENKIQYVHRIILLVCLVSFFLSDEIFGQFNVNEIKVAYIERITRFVEWPNKSIDHNSSLIFTFCVIGENPFGKMLDKAFHNRKIKNKSVKIIYINNVDELPDCELLFISKSKSKHLPLILKKLVKKSTLTISDTEGYADRGVMINLYQFGDRITFEVNETACKESDLIFSYHLFRQAKIINPIRD